MNKPPIGDRKMRWPGRESYDGAWHALWPTWKEFWDRPAEGLPQVAQPAPLDKFLETMRRGAPIPKIRVR
ncbi:hypothetical protein ACFS07_20825 [Undibacterium arcticum]